MENKTAVGILVSVALGCLLGVALVSIIAEQMAVPTNLKYSRDTVSLATTKQPNHGSINGTKEFVVTYYPDDWELQDCPLTNFVVTNSTGSVLVLDTDYNLSLTYGTFHLKNSTNTVAAFLSNNNSIVAYNYCTDDYINSSWGRTVSKMVPGFFALGILIGAAFVLFWILKKEGIELEV